MPGLSDSVNGELRAVTLFVAYLDDLSLRAWLDAVHHHVDSTRTTAAAAAALNDAVRYMIEPKLVFETRSAVMVALSRFQSREGQWMTRRRGSTQNLRPSTERAAMAVLARRYLDADQFARLYAAFEPLIPSALLFGLDRLTRDHPMSAGVRPIRCDGSTRVVRVATIG